MQFENKPIFFIKGYPVSVTVALVGAHIGAMLACAFMMATGNGAWLKELVFTSESVTSGHVWDIFLYPFFHNIGQQHIWFAIEMLMFFWFGQGVERRLGPGRFALLYALLTITPALALFFMSPVTGAFVLAGSTTLHFAVFLGFVMLYPNTPFFFGFSAKWLGIIFFSLSFLSSLAQNDWPSLIQLLSSTAAVWLGLRLLSSPSLQTQPSSPSRSWLQDLKASRDARHLEKRRQKLSQAEEKFNSSVDHILEKISKHGIQSLSPSEKQQLELARSQLLNNKPKPQP